MRRSWRSAGAHVGPAGALCPTKRTVHATAAVCGCVVFLAPRPAAAQSLAAVAAQEKARRAAITEPSHVYTESDLGRPGAHRLGPPIAAEPAAADAAHVSPPLTTAAAPRANTGSAQLPWIARVSETIEHVIGDGSAPPAEAQAIFDVFVNEVPLGETVVLLRGGEAWLPASTLARAGLASLTAGANEDTGTPYVNLARLAPGITYAVDEQALALRVRTTPDVLAVTSRDLSAPRPAGILAGRDTSGFLNYGVNWRGSGIYDLTAEAGLSVFGALVQTTLSRSSHHPLLRGLTSLTVDDRRRLVRWVGGDAYVPPGPFGGGFVMGGFGVAREFSIDPYFVRYPTVALVGNAWTPATADIYVNNHLVRREYLPPGEFQLRNVPTPTGRGVARVVVRDAFGHEQQIVSPFFVTTSLLARGLHEYRYHVGVRRQNTGTSNWGYAHPALLARHRVGLTSWMTGGYQFEAGQGLYVGGPTITSKLPLGEVELAAALSRRAGQYGTAGSIAYTYLGRPLSVGGVIRGASDRYGSLSLDPLGDRVRHEANAFAGLALGRALNLGLRYSIVDSTLRGREETTSISASGRGWLPVDLFVTASRSRRAALASTTEVFVGASLSLGPRSAASVSVAHGSGGGRGLAFDSMRSLPRGRGWGYRMRAGTAAGTPVLGSLQYQSDWGRYDVGYETLGTQSTAFASAAGGLAFIGGGVYPTRPISDAFALVRVPGIRGVRALASNQEVGRTGGRGVVLVPDLLSYYGNVLGIADQDVPLDRLLTSTEAIVAPPYRGGAVVEFPAQRLRGASGQVLWRDGTRTVVPRYGQLVVTTGAERIESPIGGGGEFFLEQVVPGRLPAQVEFLGAVCTFTLPIPATVDLVVDLGTVVCDVGLQARR